MGGATFEILGPEAEAIAAELAAWWKAEMEGELRREEPVRDGRRVAGPRQGAGSSDTVRGPDPIAVASLAISVVSLAVSLPGAALATADLAKRVELGKKLAALGEWVSRKRGKHPKLRIALLPESGAPVDVTTTDPAHVMEALGLTGKKPASPPAKDPGTSGQA